MRVSKDPFDPNRRDKRPRRRTADVIADKKAWDHKIVSAVKEALENLPDSDYVKSHIIIEDAGNIFGNWDVIRRNLCKAMEACNYEKIINRNAKDFRFFLGGRSCYVFRKKFLKDLSQSRLRKWFND